MKRSSNHDEEVSSEYLDICCALLTGSSTPTKSSEGIKLAARDVASKFNLNLHILIFARPIPRSNR